MHTQICALCMRFCCSSCALLARLTVYAFMLLLFRLFVFQAEDGIRPAQPAAVQSRVSHRNRAIACKSDREPQAGGRQTGAGTRAAPRRSNREGNWLWRPGAHAPSVPTRFWANAAGDSQRVTPTRFVLIELFDP